MASNRRIVVEFLGKDVSAGSTAAAVERKFGKLGGRLDKVGQAAGRMLAVGATAGGAALYKMGQNAAADEAAQRKLAIALQNSTGATAAQVAGVEDYISKTSLATGVSDDELRPAFQRLAQATGDVDEAQRQLAIAMDVSAGTGKSLKTVSEAMMKANNGTTASLSKLGLKTKDAQGNTLSLNDALAEMSKTFKGQAAAAAGSTDGKMKRLRVAMDELGESIGTMVLPAMEKLADIAMGAVSWIDRNRTTTAALIGTVAGFAAVLWTVSAAMRAYLAITKTVAAVTGAYRAAKQALVFWTYGEQAATLRATGARIASTASLVAHKVATVASTVGMKAAALASKAWAAATWLVNVALKAIMANPIVFLLSAIAIGLVIAYKKSETFRKIVNAAFSAVANAAKVAFRWVVDKAQAALGWLKANWKTLLAILTGPIGIAVLVITRNWDKIKAGATRAKDWIKDKFNDLVGFFKGIPGRIASAAAGMWNGISNAFRSMVNTIIGLWNRLDVRIPSVKIPGVGTYGGTGDLIPDLPYLARGGIVTRPTLAVIGEAGPEAVIPLSRGARGMGGAGVEINFNGPVYGDPRAFARFVVEALRKEKRLTGVNLGLA